MKLCKRPYYLSCFLCFTKVASKLEGVLEHHGLARVLCLKRTAPYKLRKKRGISKRLAGKLNSVLTVGLLYRLCIGRVVEYDGLIAVHYLSRRHHLILSLLSRTDKKIKLCARSGLVSENGEFHSRLLKRLYSLIALLASLVSRINAEEYKRIRRSGMLGNSRRKLIAKRSLAVSVARIEAVVYHSVYVRWELIIHCRPKSYFLGEHNGVPARNAVAYTRATACALVYIIHYFLKPHSSSVYQRNSKRASAGRASLVSRCVSDRTDVMTHPTKTAGINVLFRFFRHYHNHILLYQRPNLKGFIMPLGSSCFLSPSNTCIAGPYCSFISLPSLMPTPWWSFTTPPCARAARTPHVQIA